MELALFPDIPLWWHACGITLITLLFLLNGRAHASHIIVVAVTQLPGVILHESAHLLAGILFRAVPRSFSLIPRRNGQGGWTLGSVEFGRITAFNAVPIALAPLCLLPLAYGVFRYWFLWFSTTLSHTLLLYVSLFLLVYNALPSRQDMRVACNWKSILLYSIIGGVLGCLLYFVFHSGVISP